MWVCSDACYIAYEMSRLGKVIGKSVYCVEVFG